MTRFGRLLRDVAVSAAFLALFALLAARLNNPAERHELESFYVVDGDTLTQDRERYRLIGIDAPEYGQQCERGGVGWPCGTQARGLLVKLLAAGPAVCRGNRRDRYGRLLVVCEVQGRQVNGEMVRQGMAVSYGGYSEEEAEARRSRVGIWAGSFETPQRYRQDHREADDVRGPLVPASDFLPRSAEGGR